jgi:hypothetical protein
MAKAVRDMLVPGMGGWRGRCHDRPRLAAGPRKTVTRDGVSDAPADATLGGYSLISADSLDDAVKTVTGHPFVGRGGTLQVSQAVTP